MPRLIYVHGRGLKPPADEERRAWLASLNRGLARLQSAPSRSVADDDRFRLAYWSDLFYPHGASEATGGLDRQETRAVLALVGKFWEWPLPDGASRASGALDAPTKRFEDNFVRDVVKFFGLGFAASCSAPLHRELVEVDSDDPVMLVSHSFGTVLAYGVLIDELPTINAERQQAGRAPLRIDTWVTMGAPLGWVIDLQALVPDWKEQLIRDVDQGLQPVLNSARAVLNSIGDFTRRGFGGLLSGAPGPPGLAGGGGLFQVPLKQFPVNNVERWYNIFDSRDPVACGGGFGALAIGGAFLFDGHQRAFDVTIRNDACPPDISRPDMRAHADYQGYGQCAQLAQLVADFWNRSGTPW